MEVKKSKLTQFAKECAWGADQMLRGVCFAEEVYTNDIAMEILNGNNEVLIEVSRRFSKYSKNSMCFDAENAEVQDFQHLIEKIVECCEENNWFHNDSGT